MPVSLAVFCFIALFVTAGTVVLFGEALTNPTDIIARVDNTFLTVVAAITFFAATIGINLVANFIPPAYDIANLAPSKINFRMGGLITAVIAFFVGGLWVSVVSQIGIAGFVDTLGAVLAPVYGIMIVDYYLIRGGNLDIQDLFSADPAGRYYFDGGWNKKAIVGFCIAGVFSIGTVWVPALEALSGYRWVIGALLGGIIHWLLMRGAAVLAVQRA